MKGRAHAGSRRVAAWLPLLLFASVRPSGAQEPTWERGAPTSEPPPTIFHPTDGLNLPTALGLGGGEFLFEIAHRFVPPIEDGADALFGLDGPVRYRLGLGYGVTDAVSVRLIRSNVDDNLDLGAKVRLAEGGGPIPFRVAVAGGVAWNTEVPGVDDGTTQYHASGIVDVAVGDRAAVGLVPAVVFNPDVRAMDEDPAYALGMAAHVYLGEVWSVLAEWTLTESRVDPVQGTPLRDPASIAVQLETGGHFFRVGVTNSLRLNPAQHFIGAAQPFALDQLRLAFNITRVLRF